MKINGSGQHGYLLAAALVLVLVVARWAMLGFDFSAFFVAGTDYVAANQTPAPVAVQPGQGYDGQFFYRLALNPFDFTALKYGVTIDFPSYRAQRIVYPLLAWLFSLGGIAILVPFALILVNVLSFAGIFFFLQKIILRIEANPQFIWYPLFIFGCYMSVAKDLSEVTELFFFTGTIWFMLTKSWIKFSIFATLMLLTRETALVALAPLTLWLLLQKSSNRAMRLVVLAAPFVIFVLWKYYVNTVTQTTQIIEGTGNITFPFTGIYPGFAVNYNFSSTKNILQFTFWVAYFLWQVWLAAMVLNALIKNYRNEGELFRPMAIIYCTWLLFAICLSPAIYIDDWSFVRVFALWNMTGFLVLTTTGTKPGKWFTTVSAGLLFLTFIRLIIRP